MADQITCDAGCGATLTLPASKAAGEGWRRLSMTGTRGLVFRYVCPNCPEDQVKRDLERRARHGDLV